MLNGDATIICEQNKIKKMLEVLLIRHVVKIKYKLFIPKKKKKEEHFRIIYTLKIQKKNTKITCSCNCRE